MTQPPADRDRLRQLLAAAQREQFAPGFTDRAVARWRSERARGVDALPSFDATVTRLFTRLAPLAIAAALLLAVNNWRHRTEGQTLAQMLVGAPAASTTPPSLATMYGLGTLVVSSQE